jgi:hypothetical protein
MSTEFLRSAFIFTLANKSFYSDLMFNIRRHNISLPLFCNLRCSVRTFCCPWEGRKTTQLKFHFMLRMNEKFNLYVALYKKQHAGQRVIPDSGHAVGCVDKNECALSIGQQTADDTDASEFRFKSQHCSPR